MLSLIACERCCTTTFAVPPLCLFFLVLSHYGGARMLRLVFLLYVQ